MSRAERPGLVEREAPALPVSRQCRLLAVSRASVDVEESELTVDFDGREVVYGFTDLDELVLAYATTIHKSQGSEYPAVVIPLVCSTR